MCALVCVRRQIQGLRVEAARGSPAHAIAGEVALGVALSRTACTSLRSPAVPSNPLGAAGGWPAAAINLARFSRPPETVLPASAGTAIGGVHELLLDLGVGRVGARRQEQRRRARDVRRRHRRAAPAGVLAAGQRAQDVDAGRAPGGRASRRSSRSWPAGRWCRWPPPRPRCRRRSCGIVRVRVVVVGVVAGGGDEHAARGRQRADRVVQVRGVAAGPQAAPAGVDHARLHLGGVEDASARRPTVEPPPDAARNFSAMIFTCQLTPATPTPLLPTRADGARARACRGRCRPSGRRRCWRSRSRGRRRRSRCRRRRCRCRGSRPGWSRCWPRGRGGCSRCRCR